MFYKTDEFEEKYLSKYATKSKEAVRKRKVDKNDFRTEFQRDRDKIYHCRAFRRLMHKTQVFIMPEDAHYRTRLTHTLEVSQIARSIARGVGANENLVEAIAIGHDLGHTPFGHTGEEALNKILNEYGGFDHAKHSVKVVEKLERDGEGLNLTEQTIDGIRNHGTKDKPKSIEGKIVQISDKIAYINHDIDDAIRAGIITQEQLPKEYIDILGETSKERIDFCIKHIIRRSSNKPDIEMDKEVYTAIYGIRRFLFQNVYENEENLKERKKIYFTIKSLYDYYYNNTEALPKYYYNEIQKGEEKAIVICDHIASMTDTYAINTFEKIFVPNNWKK